jgi:hypothetical protein
MPRILLPLGHHPDLRDTLRENQKRAPPGLQGWPWLRSVSGVAVGEATGDRCLEDRALALRGVIEKFEVLQARHADHLTELEAGERGIDHLLGLHGREGDLGAVETGDLVEFGLDQTRAEHLKPHAGAIEFVGERLGEGDM